MALPLLGRRIVFSLVPALALASAAEVAARFAGPGSQFNVGGPLGWTARPGLVDYETIQNDPRPAFTVSTNADGLRTAIPREHTPGVRRIVAFGESTIFGWGQEAEDAAPLALQRILGDGYEVINAGQPGYTSEQVHLLAELLVPAYHPDGIVYFFPWNDVSKAQRTDRDLLARHPAHLAGGFLWKHSALLRWAWAHRAERTGLTSENPLMLVVHEVESEGQRTTPAQRLENLESIVATARKGGAWLLTASLPPGARYTESGEFPLVAENAANCRDLGLPYVDLSHEPAGWDPKKAIQPGDWGHFTDDATRHFMLLLSQRVREMDAGWHAGLR